MNLAIIDDHAIVLDTITSILSKNITIKEIKTFSSARDYIKSETKFWRPDIIIADLQMPEMTGIELLQYLKKHNDVRETKIIVLSSITDIQIIKLAIRHGAIGYLSKDISLQELDDAINSIMNGGQYISRKIKESLANSVFIAEQVVSQLSTKEQNVLDLICAGNTIKEIAYTLKLSKHTIQIHHKSIMKKLNVNKSTDLIVFAIQKGLYTPPL